MTLEKTRIDKLIEAASKKAGTEYKLAQAMGYSQQQINDWKNKRKPCPIEAQAIMADIAGFDAMETVAKGLLERSEGNRRYIALEQAVGKAFATIRAAGVANIGAKASWVFSAGLLATVVQQTQCVLQLSKKRLSRRFFHGVEGNKTCFLSL